MSTSLSQDPMVEVDFGSVLTTDEKNLKDLWSLTHSPSSLQKAGYVLWQLGPSDLDKKKRCGRCSKVIRKGHERAKSRAQSVKLAPAVAQLIAAGDYPRPIPEPESEQSSMSMHSRSVSLQFWTCCGNFMSDIGCAAEQFHTAKVYRRGELESNWEYFTTPGAALDTPTDYRAAVVIDCEMGTAASGDSELIRVSAVDFFTREVLVDSLVWPDVRMAHFNTRYSGVTRKSMETARRARRTLAGRSGARAALWRFVGPSTVLVGHSANSDLNSLRWIHAIVIDTLLLEMRIQPQLRGDQQRPQSKGSGDEGGRADGDQQQPAEVAEVVVVQETASKENKQPKYPGLSLKALAAERLKRTIQVKGQGHDSLEDALATRDLLLWHMVHRPEPPIP
ncbi:RNA exonuclease [Cordyceps fumosorosea ARSEF 2679]|uniref:RNA exonuclease n=1 Tax=Cordyceps fumosorosea (strain ARSEF 2679) TaxID=1081104 RepID=A0A162JTP8_CORFA|nr:RNA exonuclease [Cordyceps fumosorosea ARSEF 2679]OAA73652.1 RNA exonuclease [Cordyceps fumosorosea ARSEF 2679]